MFNISNWEFMRDIHGFHVFGKKYSHFWELQKGIGNIFYKQICGDWTQFVDEMFIIILPFFVQLPSWNSIVGENIKSTIAKSQYVVKSLVFYATLTTS
jgi:hypothetical protein